MPHASKAREIKKQLPLNVMFRLHCLDQALETLMKAVAQTRQTKFPSFVYRAGTQQGPSFDLKDKIEEGNVH